MTVDPYTVASVVLGAVEQALRGCDRQPVRSYVAAGSIPYDDCCGMLVVAPERVYLSANFPDESPSLDLCPFVAVEVVVLLQRCVPVVSERGRAPSPATLDAAYATLLGDSAVIWNALTSFDEWDVANLSQAWSGAEGGCIGIETRLTVGLDRSGWCVDCPPESEPEPEPEPEP